MKAIFTDLQDDDNPRNGRPVVDRQQVLQALEELRTAECARMCQISVAERGSLLVGVGREFGCVQQSNEDGMPPYLMAVSRTSVGGPREIEFAVGGTMTPIDRRYLLPMDQVADVVAEFVTSGERSDVVRWEEFEPSRLQ